MDSMKSETHLWMQWAAVTTQVGSMRTPPHQWPINPNFGWRSCRDTCQGQEPRLLGFPLNIRPVVLPTFFCLSTVEEVTFFTDRIARGCLCDAEGHPQAVIQKLKFPTSLTFTGSQLISIKYVIYSMVWRNGYL